ncbi:hypothetical protein LX36DRAFT_672087 [Colletotrichum falcatum]|nr:hypothetical protein LX36DRAFT_672087 [Colletotrichum falcatum]
MHYALFSVVLAASVIASPAPKKAHDANNANNINNNANNTADAANAALQTKVLSTINQWLGDIQTVNNFVDTAGQLKSNAEISNAAATAFVAAQSEGDSSNALQADVQLDAKGLAAAKALNAQFNIIGPAINDTIANPQNLQANLAKINGARCPAPVGQDAIGNEGAVQAAAAKAVGTNSAPPALADKTTKQPVGTARKQPADKTIREPADKVIKQPVDRTIKQLVDKRITRNSSRKYYKVGKLYKKPK